MRTEYYRDAFCVAIFGAAALMGLNRLPELFSRWPLLRHTLQADVPGGPGRPQPRSGNDCRRNFCQFFHCRAGRHRRA